MKLKEFLGYHRYIYINVVAIEFGLKGKNMGTSLAVFSPKIVETNENTWMFIDGENGLSIRIENRDLEVLSYDELTYHLTVGTSDCANYTPNKLGADFK